MHWPPICGSESTTSARSPRRPSSKTWNRPTGPAPTITTSVTVASLERSSDKDVLQLDALAAAGFAGCRRESLLDEPFGIEKPRLILRAAVTEHRDDHVSGAELARDAHGGGDVDATRAAEEEALLVKQAVHVADGIRILDVHGVIERRIREVRGDAADADALRDGAAASRLQHTVADEFIETAAGRVREHAPHRLAARFQILGDARDGSTRACRRDERIDAPVRLLPNLRSRRLDVRAAVRDVVELVGPDRVAERGGDALRDLLVLVRIAVRDRGDLVQLGAQHLEQAILLGGLIVGHHDDAAIAARAAHVSEPDAGIAGGALNDDAAGPQLAAPFGILDDRKRRAILD